MTNDEIINAVAPCTLMCYTCVGYTKGGIYKHAFALYELFKGWYEAHVKNTNSDNLTKERIEKLNRIIIFNEMLEELIGHPKCEGCRKNDAKHWGCVEGCAIPLCVKEHGIDFCADCKEFPCQRNIMPEGVRQRWLDGNHFIKEHGYGQYFEKNKGISHYIEHYDASEQ